MTSVTSKKIPYISAVQFKESFFEPAPEIGYVFVGNHLPYANESSPNPIVDSVNDEKLTWENIIAAKKITGNDVELVIPKLSWTANTKYKQYDDLIDLDELLTGNNSLNVKPMYVYTSQRNVYKCLSNNSSANSTVEPTGDYTSSNGNIATSDGYIWKYMFNVKPSNKFLSSDWVPAPTSTSQLDYNINPIGVVNGELTTIVVENTGSGFYENNVAVIPIFSTGCTRLNLANTTNVAANMSVSGTGIAPGTFISRIDVPNNNIFLSTATTAAGGGNTTANQIALTTRIFIDGDGTGAVAAASINANGFLTKVTVTTIGINYFRANAFVYGTGSNASIRVIRDMKYGHAYNPARELGSNSVMVVSRIGEIDSTENGKIPANTTFRQYGIFVNPHKYGESTVVSPANASPVVSQATVLTLTSGSNYSIDEFAYQGLPNDTTAANTIAHGSVLDQSFDRVRLTNVRGTFRTGVSLRGASSGVSDRLIVTIQNPEFEPYSGDILYTENATKITRTEGQAENIKLIVRF
jgi:hypothetical protein